MKAHAGTNTHLPYGAALGRRAPRARSLVASLVAVASVGSWALPARAAAPDEAAGVEVPTKIQAVTVFADRARVTRVGTVTVKEPAKGAGETSRLFFSGLPGWIDPGSVRVRVLSGGSGKVSLHDVSVDKTFLARASEESVRKAEAAVQEIRDQLAALSDEDAVLKAELEQVQSIRAFTVAKIPRDVATRPIKMATYGQVIDFVAERARRVRASRRAIEAKRRALRPELRRRERARDALRARAKLQQSRVTAAVEGHGKIRVELTYLTPGASWEPVSEIRAQGSTQATLVQLASVIQTTGEDWTGARLSFATQSPSQMLAVPEAAALLIGGSGGRGLGQVMGRMGDSFAQANQRYLTDNMASFKGNAAMMNNFQQQQQLQARAVQTFAALSKRGTTAHFDALAQRTVRADGKAVRVPIARATFAMKAQVVGVPEVSLNAVRSAEVTNTSDQPILPGRAALFVDGAFVGTSALDFVPPGDTFSLFLGVHDRLKLTRALDRKRSAKRRHGKRTELTVSFLVTAQNLSDAPVTVVLTDRVPVVQGDDIELDDVHIPKGARRNSDGIVRWTALLAPRQTRRWRVEYTLDYPTGLVARHRGAPSGALNAPAAAPSVEQMMQPQRKVRRKRSKQMLFDQIDNLEQAL